MWLSRQMKPAMPGGNAGYLRRNGTIDLRGSIAIEGSLSVNGEPYKPCTCGTEGT